MQVRHIDKFRIYYTSQCDAHNAIRSFSYKGRHAVLCERCLQVAINKIANGHLTDPEDEDLKALFSDWRQASFQ